MPESEETRDPLVDFVEDECPTCGAYMLNPALHRDYHARQKAQFEHLDRKASRLTGMETYG